MDQLYATYLLLELKINNKIQGFKNIWKNQNKERIFQELTFCLLTPQSKAENAWETINILTHNNKIFVGEANDMSQDMNLIRFKNNKAKYIEEARKIFFDKNNTIMNILSSGDTILKKRNLLKKTIKGYGLKESSHFLRNIGFVEDITILDRHILRNLESYHVIESIPKTITEKQYFEIENKMLSFSKKIDIPVGALDFVFWYNSKNTLFK